MRSCRRFRILRRRLSFRTRGILCSGIELAVGPLPDPPPEYQGRGKREKNLEELAKVKLEATMLQRIQVSGRARRTMQMVHKQGAAEAGYAFASN